MPGYFIFSHINACIVGRGVLLPQFTVSSEGLGLHKMLPPRGFEPDTSRMSGKRCTTMLQLLKRLTLSDHISWVFSFIQFLSFMRGASNLTRRLTYFQSLPFRRSAVRKTYGSLSKNNTSILRHVFFMGKVDNPSRMRQVTREARDFRDIVILDMEENYRNFTLKVVMMLHWFSTYCQEAR